jgi:hypothetical protein
MAHYGLVSNAVARRAIEITRFRLKELDEVISIVERDYRQITEYTHPVPGGTLPQEAVRTTSISGARSAISRVTRNSAVDIPWCKSFRHQSQYFQSATVRGPYVASKRHQGTGSSLGRRPTLSFRRNEELSSVDSDG